jgi:hypothetical protein
MYLACGLAPCAIASAIANAIANAIASPIASAITSAAQFAPISNPNFKWISPISNLAKLK